MIKNAISANYKKKEINAKWLNSQQAKYIYDSIPTEQSTTELNLCQPFLRYHA